jgi:hypothetical protein
MLVALQGLVPAVVVEAVSPPVHQPRDCAQNRRFPRAVDTSENVGTEVRFALTSEKSRSSFSNGPTPSAIRRTKGMILMVAVKLPECRCSPRKDSQSTQRLEQARSEGLLEELR